MILMASWLHSVLEPTLLQVADDWMLASAMRPRRLTCQGPQHATAHSASIAVPSDALRPSPCFASPSPLPQTAPAGAERRGGLWASTPFPCRHRAQPQHTPGDAA